MSIIIYSVDINPLSALSALQLLIYSQHQPQTQKEVIIVSQFNFNLIDLAHLEVIENLKTFLKGKEAISTVKVQNNDGFYVTIVVPEAINDVRMVDIVNNGDYDFEVKVSELYDIRAIENWFTSDDKEIIEVEHFLAYDAIKYVCRHWDEL